MKIDRYIRQITILFIVFTTILIASIAYITWNCHIKFLVAILLFIFVIYILFLERCRKFFINIKKNHKKTFKYQHEINTITRLNGIRFISYLVEKGIFISLNKMGEGEYFEFTPETLYSYTHPNDLSLIKGIVERLNQAKVENMSYEYRLKIRDTGNYSWRYTIIRPLEINSQGKVTSYIASDLDNDKAHEMTNNLSLFRKKIMFITSINLTMFIQYNRKEKLFIRLDSSGEKESHSIPLDFWFDHVYPEDLPICKQLLKVMDEQLEEQYHTEYRYSFPSEYRWFSIDIAVYEKDENGEYLSYMCLCSDIDTRKKELQKEIELLHKAELANKLKDSFINNLSHEIRTPLNAIIGFSNLIDKNLTDEELIYYKKIINDNNSQLLSVIDSTIDKSLFETNSMTMKMTYFTVKEFLKKIYQKFTTQIPQGIDFNLVYDESDASIRTDGRWITNIISALIKNAITFTPKGSITLGYQCKDNGILIYVKDTGIGIAPKDQRRIFEMFEQVDDFTPGLGMGLNLCKTAITRLSGTIGVESEEGKGSKFWFWIPCDPSKPATAQ